MSLFNIDSEKCKRDGICVAECPMKIITMPDAKGVPVAVPNAESLCILCGHCVVVCPHGAFSHKNMALEDCPPLQKDLKVEAPAIEQFLKSRRSARVFKEEPLPGETLDKLIDIASYAPSGHNSQPLHWTVIDGKEDVRQVAEQVIGWMKSLVEKNDPMAKKFHLDMVVMGWEFGRDVIFRDAPQVIVAHAPKSELSAPVAATVALTYLELAAHSLGLGACWAGFFYRAAIVYPPLIELLDLPEGHVTLGAMMVGRNSYKYHRLPLRKEPRVTRWSPKG